MSGSWDVYIQQFGLDVHEISSSAARPRGGLIAELCECLWQTGEVWHVSFDPECGGPQTIQFDTLKDWTTHSIPGVR
jgi:hypothetical protein